MLHQSTHSLSFSAGFRTHERRPGRGHISTLYLMILPGVFDAKAFHSPLAPHFAIGFMFDRIPAASDGFATQFMECAN